jgi:hypothetical protein
MISQATFDQLQQLGEEIQRDKSIVSQRSVDICWHWWRVGQALTADPDLYVRGTMTISADTSVRICEALGLSTRLMKPTKSPAARAQRRGPYVSSELGILKYQVRDTNPGRTTTSSIRRG